MIHKFTRNRFAQFIYFLGLEINVTSCTHIHTQSKRATVRRVSTSAASACMPTDINKPTHFISQTQAGLKVGHPLDGGNERNRSIACTQSLSQGSIPRQNVRDRHCTVHEGNSRVQHRCTDCVDSCPPQQRVRLLQPLATSDLCHECTSPFYSTAPVSPRHALSTLLSSRWRTCSVCVASASSSTRSRSILMCSSTSISIVTP